MSLRTFFLRTNNVAVFPYALKKYLEGVSVIRLSRLSPTGLHTVGTNLASPTIANFSGRLSPPGPRLNCASHNQLWVGITQEDTQAPSPHL